MTVNAINGTLLTALSAIDGVSLSTISEINGQTKAAAGCAHPTWTGLTGNSSDSGGVITKNSGGGAWNQGGVSVETQSGDFRFAYYQETTTNQFMIGTGVDSSCSSFSTIDNAWFFNGSAFNVYEEGSSITGAVSFTKVMVVTERIGTALNYYYKTYTSTRPAPDDAGRTLHRGPVTVTSGTTQYINEAIFTQGGTVTAADACWESI